MTTPDDDHNDDENITQAWIQHETCRKEPGLDPETEECVIAHYGWHKEETANHEGLRHLRRDQH